MKTFILRILGFNQQERYILKSIMAARNVQDFLWGDANKEWDFEEWKRMIRKRVSKLEEISLDNPHHKVEIKKRVLQISAVSINLLTKIDARQIQKQSNIVSNLPGYGLDATNLKQ